MSEPGSLVRLLSGRQTTRNYHSDVIPEIGLGIAQGRLAVGSILPNDAEMMDAYGVSRTVLREAVKTLAAKGLVEARAKVGTRVLPRNRWNLCEWQVPASIFEAGPDAAFLASFVELRETLEMQIAALAAEHRSAEQLPMPMYWLNQRAASSQMGEPFALAEFEFHRILCEATQNPFLRSASGLVEFGVVQATAPRIRAGIEEMAQEKADLYEAMTQWIGTGNTEAVRRAISRVLAIDRAWILKGTPA